MCDDSLEYSLLCSSIPVIILSFTAGSFSSRIVVPTLMSRHFISFFLHSIWRYPTISFIGQDVIMATPRLHDCLCCFLHLMWTAKELSMESASFVLPDLSRYCFSTSAWEHGLPRLESPMLKSVFEFFLSFLFVRYLI